MLTSVISQVTTTFSEVTDRYGHLTNRFREVFTERGEMALVSSARRKSPSPLTGVTGVRVETAGE